MKLKKRATEEATNVKSAVEEDLIVDEVMDENEASVTYGR